MRGLYAIVDLGLLEAKNVDPVAFTEALLDGPLAAVQLRAKRQGARETLAILRAIAPLCHRRGVPLVANDRPDLATLAGADMVHVGQSDAPSEFVRRIAPGLGIGISTHQMAELAHALHMLPSYVAFGPIFPTTTKSDAEPVVGVAALREASAMARVAGIPLVAIGGVHSDNVVQLRGLCDAVAIVSGLMPSGSPGESGSAQYFVAVSERAHLLRRLFSGAEPTGVHIAL